MIPEEDHNSNFKPSDLGPIPPHWSRLKLKDVCSVRQGLQIPIANRLKAPTKTSKEYITIQSINRKNQEREYVESPSERVVCSPEDILMTRTGNTGIIVTDVSGAFHNNFFLIDYNRNKISKKFLVEYLRSRRVQHVLLTKAGSSTIPDLNHKDFYSIDLPIPPLPEQKKIAQILSTWDKAIETVEKLITNSQQKKKALMQQLLTGKKRFPGFDGEWKEVRLENMCKIATGKKDVNEGNPHGLYPFYTCAIVPTKSDSYSFDCEAILIAGNGAIGTTHYYIGKFEAYQRTYVLSEFSNIDGRYLYHFINTFFIQDVEREKQHGAMPYIKLGLLKKFKLIVPSLEEQRCISSALDNAVHDEYSFGYLLSNIRKQKKALMQQLLTGKRRVRVNNDQPE